MARRTTGFLLCLALAGLMLSSAQQVRDHAQPPAGSVVIRSLKCWCGGSTLGKLCPEISMGGVGFGAQRETHSGTAKITRVVVVDGKPITDAGEYYAWSDTGATFDVDDLINPIIYDHIYKFAIGEITDYHNKPAIPNLTIISAEFPFRFLISWNTSVPTQSGHVGDAIMEQACGIGSSQGSQKLMMGSVEITNIVSWGNPPGYIIFVVPPWSVLQPGTYDLYIMRDGKIISNKKHFTIL